MLADPSESWAGVTLINFGAGACRRASGLRVYSDATAALAVQRSHTDVEKGSAVIAIDLPRDGSELPVDAKQDNTGLTSVRVTGHVQLQSWEVSTFQGVNVRFAHEVMGDLRDLGQEMVTSFQTGVPGYDSFFTWELHREVPTEGRLRIDAVENFGEVWGEEKGSPASCGITFYSDSSVTQPEEPPKPPPGATGRFTIEAGGASCWAAPHRRSATGT